MDFQRRTYGWWVAGLAAAELVSWAIYHVSGGMTMALVISCLTLVIIAWKQPRWLAYISLAEIIVGGKGYLFFASIHGVTLSVRTLIFLIVLLRFLPACIRKVKSWWLQPTSAPVAWLGIWVGAMVIWAYLRGHGLHNIFLDANAFAALAYLPLWWSGLTNQPYWKSTAMTVVLAGATVLALKSLIILFCFSHALSFAGPLYHWVRDTGIGEITWINGNSYRVFLYSQVYDMLVMMLLLTLYAGSAWERWLWAPLIASAVGTYISLSRSFWLGAAVAAVVCILVLMRRKGARWWKIGVGVPLILAAWFVTSWATNFPAVFSSGQPDPLISRITSTQSAQAATARANQFAPLVQAIARHPIIGSGFGATVTYFSTDPRVHGWRTTYAFELGYLDLLLKIGAVGLLLFGWRVTIIIRGLRQRELFGLIIASVALLVVHATTPYLNHPLGLGWLALVSLYAYA